jgi:uncharacterized cupin superfamily protein
MGGGHYLRDVRDPLLMPADPTPIMPWLGQERTETMSEAKPAAIAANKVPARPRGTIYPPPLNKRVAGRDKAQLGDFFGLTNFGVNLTRLEPGSQSALRHTHSKQDEFVYILEGEPMLITNAGESLLKPGMCAGFKAGNGDAHHLINKSARDVVYLEIGDRTKGDEPFYPDDDLQLHTNADGKVFRTRKDGTPY